MKNKDNFFLKVTLWFIGILVFVAILIGIHLWFSYISSTIDLGPSGRLDVHGW